jgi:hypothetical protein
MPVDSALLKLKERQQGQQQEHQQEQQKQEEQQQDPPSSSSSPRNLFSYFFGRSSDRIPLPPSRTVAPALAAASHSPPSVPVSPSTTSPPVSIRIPPAAKDMFVFHSRANFGAKHRACFRLHEEYLVSHSAWQQGHFPSRSLELELLLRQQRQGASSNAAPP